jgi:hypothetical protein
LTSLAALLDPDLVEKVIDDYWYGERPNTYVIDLGWRLLSMARDCGALSPADLAKLDDLPAALETHREAGLTPKNQGVVRAILSGDVWQEMIDLPELIMEEAKTTIAHAPQRATLSAQVAVGIAILTFAPMRISNLVGIRIGVHLLKPASRSLLPHEAAIARPANKGEPPSARKLLLHDGQWRGSHHLARARPWAPLASRDASTDVALGRGDPHLAGTCPMSTIRRRRIGTSTSRDASRPRRGEALAARR